MDLIGLLPAITRNSRVYHDQSSAAGDLNTTLLTKSLTVFNSFTLFLAPLTGPALTLSMQNIDLNEIFNF
jgi:hypothetical protein